MPIIIIAMVAQASAMARQITAVLDDPQGSTWEGCILGVWILFDCELAWQNGRMRVQMKIGHNMLSHLPRTAISGNQ